MQKTTQMQVVTTQTAFNQNQGVEKVALFGPDGQPLLYGASAKLTGYTPVAEGNVAATDTVLQAIHKLEVRLTALE